MLNPIKREQAHELLKSRLNELLIEREDALKCFYAGELVISDYIKELSLRIKSIEICLEKEDAWFYTDGEDIYIQHNGHKTTYKPIFSNGMWVADVREVKDVTLYSKPECFIEASKGVNNLSKVNKAVEYFNTVGVKPLKCIKCGSDFQLTQRECYIYRVTRKNLPKLCPSCRSKNS